METELTEEVLLDISSNIWKVLFLGAPRRNQWFYCQPMKLNTLRWFDCLSSCVNSELAAGSEDQGEQACEVDD